MAVRVRLRIRSRTGAEATTPALINNKQRL